MGRGFGGGMGQATSSTINNGTLVFDVYTMADKQQVWQGREHKRSAQAAMSKRTKRTCKRASTNY